MEFDQLRSTIRGSHPSDWHFINRSGPTYHDRFTSLSGPGEQEGVEVDFHSKYLVYKPDIDLTIVHGMGESAPGFRSKPTFKWSEEFADPEVTVHNADVFWRGSLVDRVHYADVDGGRGFLPLGDGHQATNIGRYEYDLVRLLDRIAGHHEFERYFGEVPFEFKD